MQTARYLLFFAAMTVILPACASPRPRFTGIRIGMTGSELVSVIGAPRSVRRAPKTENGKTEEFWEYVFKPEKAKTATDVTAGVLTAKFNFFEDPTEDRYVIFHLIDDRLARWGPKNPESSAAPEP